MANIFETIRARLRGDEDLRPPAKCDWHRCPHCGRNRILGPPYDNDHQNEFHFIPNVGGGYTFPYCEECHDSLSLPAKKILVWRLVSCSGFWPGQEKDDAIRRLRRGEMLCAQIDKGL